MGKACKLVAKWLSTMKLKSTFWGEAPTDPSSYLECLVEAGAGWEESSAGLLSVPWGRSHGLACGLSHSPCHLACLQPPRAQHPPSVTLRADLQPAVLKDARLGQKNHSSWQGISTFGNCIPGPVLGSLTHFILTAPLGSRHYFLSLYYRLEIRGAGCLPEELPKLQCEERW